MKRCMKIITFSKETVPEPAVIQMCRRCVSKGLQNVSVQILHNSYFYRLSPTHDYANITSRFFSAGPSSRTHPGVLHRLKALLTECFDS